MFAQEFSEIETLETRNYKEFSEHLEGIYKSSCQFPLLNAMT